MSKYKRSGRPQSSRCKRTTRPRLEALESRLVLSTISGTVFNDLHVTGAIAADDPGLANRTVFVDLHNDGVLHSDDPSAVTDASGHYVITGVNPGTLRVVTYSGDNPTTPTAVVINSNSSTANFGLQPESTVLPTVPSPAPFAGGGNAVVEGLYRNILGRDADPAGLAHWDAQLKAGESAAQVAGQFFQSPEYTTDVVKSYYKTYLGRDGDPAGVASWVAKLQAGASEEEVAAAFLSSPEYSAKHVTDGAFVQSLYENILGREGDPAGINNWTQLLGAGTSRGAVAASFIGSPESSQRAIDGDYNVFLARVGDTSGVNSWVAQVQHGSMTLAEVAALFAGSPEYATRASQVTAAPAITSAGSTTFTTGTLGKFTVTTTGTPTAVLSETGTLPTGVTFVDNKDGTATLASTAATPAGSTTLTITAANGVLPNATQTFTLTVAAAPAPAITSAGSTTFTTGTLGKFTVTTTGTPTATLSEAGTLPTGVTFVDNKDGTATLASTAATLAGSTTLTITASNGVGSPVTQSFTLTVAAATAAPSIGGLSLTSGPAAGGTTVTIYGTNFTGATGATAVQFGAVNATSYTVDSATQITAVSPVGSPGYVDITVTTPGGTSPHIGRTRSSTSPRPPGRRV